MREVVEKLTEELRGLERELRVDLPREISRALAMGDLRENAEYHAALERQSFVKARIGQLRERLSELGTVDLSRIPQGLLMAVPIMAMTVITGGLNEELGWRGFLLPRIQGRYNALTSGLIVGAFHGFWHIPLFFIAGLSPYQELAEYMGVDPAILGYALVYVTPWSILKTCLLNNTKGSLLLISVFHGSQAWVLSLWNVGNPMGYLSLSAAMIIAAIAVVFIFGAENLSKTSERYVIEDN